MTTNQRTLLLSDDDVRQAFDWEEAVAALERAYCGIQTDALFPPRTMARGDSVWLRTLSGILPEQGVMGAKLIAASPAVQAASYLMPIFDIATMELTALLDANRITGFRTAATSALAARRLVATESPRVAVIGSGFEAKAHLEALAGAMALGTISVFSPREASRTAFCEVMADKGISVGAADTAQDAVAASDLVICAARSRDESPTLHGAWLRPGMTVISIGSTLPEQRELDSEAIARSDMIAADMAEEVAHDTGDMLVAAREGIDFAGKLVSLADVVSGRHPGRTNPDQILTYKSVGAAIQDLAVAAMCVARARTLGIGTLISAPISPVNKGK